MEETVDFSSKWGIASPDATPHTRTTYSVWHVLVGQFVCLCALLWILGPSFLVRSGSVFRGNRVCLAKLVACSVAIVTLTYFIPAISREWATSGW
jgi:hypothetical protein